MKFKDKLNVLVIGEWDFAGCGYFLSQAINEYTNNTSRAVRLHQSTLGFPYDVQAPTENELRDLWKAADVIHIHDDYRGLPLDLQDKPTIVTYHGSLYRASPDTYNRRDKNHGWLQTVATPDLTLLGPRWLPDTRPDMSGYIDRSKNFTSCHAPTKRKVKGTDAVIAACKGVVGIDVIENVQWQEALARKGRCHITIDQFQLGYGCNAIEAWLMNQVVVGGAINKKTLEVIERAAGYIPFVLASESPESIREQIERLMTDTELYAKYQKLGSEYVKKFHSMSSVANAAINYYHESIEMFYSRGCTIMPSKSEATFIASPMARNVKIKPTSPPCQPEPNDHLMIAIEYLGQSDGLITFEVNQRKYKFSRSKSVQFVDARDVRIFLSMHDTIRRNRRDKKKHPGMPLFKRHEV